MKFAITNRERLALVMTIVPIPTPNGDRRALRRKAWAELDANDLALDIADMAQFRGSATFSSEWLDRKAMKVFDISPGVAEFLLSSLAGQADGPHSDYVDALTPRLTALTRGTYELPFAPCSHGIDPARCDEPHEVAAE